MEEIKFKPSIKIEKYILIINIIYLVLLTFLAIIISPFFYQDYIYFLWFYLL